MVGLGFLAMVLVIFSATRTHESAEHKEARQAVEKGAPGFDADLLIRKVCIDIDTDVNRGRPFMRAFNLAASN